MRHEIIHQIGAKAGTQIVRDGVDAGLSWTAIMTSCETAIAIVITAMITLSKTDNQEMFAAEMIDTMTEHAHRRAMCLITGQPYEG